MVIKKYLHLPLLLAVLVAGYSCASGNGAYSAPTDIDKGGNFITDISPSEVPDGLSLGIVGSQKLQYTVFRLQNPSRLVIDMPGIDASAFSVPLEIAKGVASRVVTKYFPKSGNSRVEVFLKETVRYKVTRIADNKIVVDISAHRVDAFAGPERTIGENETEILGIDLREASGLARIVIPYKGETPKFTMVRKRGIKRITLDIFNSKIRRKNEKLHSVTIEDSIVKNVAVFQFRTKPEGEVKIIANLNDFQSSNVYVDDGKIVFDIGSSAVLAQASLVVEEKEAKKKEVVEVTKEKGIEDYTGQKLSLDFQNADIHNILRIIAEVSELNIITSGTVQGKVTMRLKDVPWDLALDIILKNNGLGMKRTGNIIRVATLSEMLAEEKLKSDQIKVVEEVEPMFLKIFQVNYEDVDKLKVNLETVKSGRGTIDVNKRTNTLIVQDVKGKLSEMEKLIEVLDRQTKQVLIEARIIEVSHNFSKELGIRWGGQYAADTGQAFPATIGLSGIASSGEASSAAGSLVNLPSDSRTGNIGVTFGSINGTALLDMQLMAMQNEGKGKILSMPKITTMDNTEALIESGRDIPYQTTSSEGTTTEFKKATLSLKVTPHVTIDNFIRLEIEANKDEPDWANQLTGGAPPIITKHAKTEILIADGDTTVIGGLFKENSTRSSASVPFFSDIPFFGWLFKNKSNSSEGEELLIFITPKIL